MIAVPAGFGKSTLVSAWLAQCPLPSAWLSLDHGNADLGELVIVLDDYHGIDNWAVHRLLTTLVLHPPRALHLVLCSRLDPPLPLAKLRAQGKMVELRAPDLRFSRGEAAAFFEHLLGYALDDATLGTLDRYIEGWPVGLRLAALSLRRPSNASELGARPGDRPGTVARSRG